MSEDGPGTEYFLSHVLVPNEVSIVMFKIPVSHMNSSGQVFSQGKVRLRDDKIPWISNFIVIRCLQFFVINFSRVRGFCFFLHDLLTSLALFWSTINKGGYLLFIYIPDPSIIAAHLQVFNLFSDYADCTHTKRG